MRMKTSNTAKSMDRPNSEHEQWLRDFADAVRRADLDAGRALCEQGILSFGTVCWRSENLDMLVRDQWEHIWNTTQGFDFDYDAVRALACDDMVTLLTTWQSNGTDEQGGTFPRRGRATIVLRRRDNVWKAAHTHFSMDPTA